MIGGGVSPQHHPGGVSGNLLPPLSSYYATVVQVSTVVATRRSPAESCPSMSDPIVMTPPPTRAEIEGDPRQRGTSSPPLITVLALPEPPVSPPRRK